MAASSHHLVVLKYKMRMQTGPRPEAFWELSWLWSTSDLCLPLIGVSAYSRKIATTVTAACNSIQEDCEFKANLGYIASSRLARMT